MKFCFTLIVARFVYRLNSGCSKSWVKTQHSLGSIIRRGKQAPEGRCCPCCSRDSSGCNSSPLQDQPPSTGYRREKKTPPHFFTNNKMSLVNLNRASSLKKHKALIKSALAQALIIALSASLCPVAFCLTNVGSQCGFHCNIMEAVIERCPQLIRMFFKWQGVLLCCHYFSFNDDSCPKEILTLYG